MYQHLWHSGEAIPWPVGKAVCVGRNYVAHAHELNNPVPEKPLLFIKPSTAMQPLSSGVTLPARLGDHHFEAEIALLVGERIDSNTINPLSHIKGIALALDLTLRDVQTELKEQGHPWERAKAYDGSCPISVFYPVSASQELDQIQFQFWLNNELRQVGNVSDMLFSPAQLIDSICAMFTLLPGDIILTGTPAGVGKLHQGDELKLQLNEFTCINSKVTLR